MTASGGRKLAIAGMGIIFIVFISSFAYAYSGEGGWFTDEIDECGSYISDSRTAMAMDEEGKIHVAYRSIEYHPDAGYGYAIMHAMGHGSDWTSTKINSCNDRLLDIDIRITESGSVHIAWCHQSPVPYDHDIMVLGYAADTGEGWETQTVHIENGESAGVTIDRDGIAHALCIVEDYNPMFDPYDGTSYYLAYELQEWICTSEAWNMTRIHANPVDHQWTSVSAIASETGEDVRGLMDLRSNQTGTYAPMRVRITDEGFEYNETYGLTGPRMSAHASIDSQGRMHVILLQHGAPYSVVYVMDDDITELNTYHAIYSDDYSVLFYYYDVTSLFIDSNDEPHIAYLTYDRQTVLARIVEGEWVTEEVGSRSMPKASCGITMIKDDSGISQIVYHARVSERDTALIYATSDSSEVLYSALIGAALFTGIGALIVVPIVLVTFHLWTKSREGRAQREALGLYDIQRRLRKRKP